MLTLRIFRVCVIALVAIADGIVLVWQIYELYLLGVFLTLLGLTCTEYILAQLKGAEFTRFVIIGMVGWIIGVLIGEIHHPLLFAVSIGTLTRFSVILLIPQAFNSAFFELPNARSRALIGSAIATVLPVYVSLKPIYGVTVSLSIGILLGVGWFVFLDRFFGSTRNDGSKLYD